MDTEAIGAIVEEMANLKRERQEMEPAIKRMEDKTQQCLATKEELKSDYVSRWTLSFH